MPVPIALDRPAGTLMLYVMLVRYGMMCCTRGEHGDQREKLDT